MATFDAKADTPVATVAADDKFPFGDVSADGWDTIEAADLFNALAAVATAPTLESPALTSVPTAPTADPGTDTTQVATTAFVTAAVAALVDAAPGALDTLNELAAALGDDADFAGSVTTSLAAKQPLDATLTALAGVTVAADQIIYATGADAFTVTSLTAAARTVLDDATVAAMVDTLGGAAATGTGGLVRATSPTLTTPVVVGDAVFRRSGGSAGVHEIQVTYTGSEARVANVENTGANQLVFGALVYRFMDRLFGTTTVRVASGVVQLGNSGLLAVSTGNPEAVACDVSLYRAATKVWGLGAGAASGNGTLSSVPLSPAQITADQDNYAPGVAMFYRLSTDASRTLTGLSISQVNGQVAEIWNVGAQNLVLAHDSASSSAANQFLTSTAADVTLAANEMAFLRWFSAEQSGSGGWRVTKG